jgi:type IV secretory pathway TrbD component
VAIQVRRAVSRQRALAKDDDGGDQKMMFILGLVSGVVGSVMAWLALELFYLRRDENDD